MNQESYHPFLNALHLVFHRSFSKKKKKEEKKIGKIIILFPSSLLLRFRDTESLGPPFRTIAAPRQSGDVYAYSSLGERMAASWTAAGPRTPCYTQESPAEAAVEFGGTFTVAVAAEPSGTPTPSATHWPAVGAPAATPTPEPTTGP